MFRSVLSNYPALRVTSGLHQGARMQIELPVCRIGSSTGSDVVLSDDGIACEHLMLRFYSRMVAVEAVGGDVTVGKKHLAKGTGWRTEYPVIISFSGVCLELSRPDYSAPPVLRWLETAFNRSRRLVHQALSMPYTILSSMGKSSMGKKGKTPFFPVSTGGDALSSSSPPSSSSGFFSAGVRSGGKRGLISSSLNDDRDVGWLNHLRRGGALTALFVVFLLVVGGYQFIRADEAGANVAQVLMTMRESDAEVAGSSLSLAEEVEVPTPAEALRQRLTEAGLDRLEVREASNHLEVSGEYLPGLYGEWQAIQMWFDENYGNHQVLISSATPANDPARPILRLQAVWFGENPYVINVNGDRLYPGASLEDGWRLAEILSNQIVLRRNDSEFVLTL